MARQNGTTFGVATSGRNGDLETKAVYLPPTLANPGNVIDLQAGGGHMGHTLAHDNEAPFPVELSAFFIRSFCKPQGIVADPFVGSGTTLQAAIENDRRGIACDLRESQVALTKRRLAGVTPALPGFA